MSTVILGLAAVGMFIVQTSTGTKLTEEVSSFIAVHLSVKFGDGNKSHRRHESSQGSGKPRVTRIDGCQTHASASSTVKNQQSQDKGDDKNKLDGQCLTRGVNLEVNELRAASRVVEKQQAVTRSCGKHQTTEQAGGNPSVMMFLRFAGVLAANGTRNFSEVTSAMLSAVEEESLLTPFLKIAETLKEAGITDFAVQVAALFSVAHIDHRTPADNISCKFGSPVAHILQSAIDADEILKAASEAVLKARFKVFSPHAKAVLLARILEKVRMILAAPQTLMELHVLDFIRRAKWAVAVMRFISSTPDTENAIEDLERNVADAFKMHRCLLFPTSAREVDLPTPLVAWMYSELDSARVVPALIAKQVQ